jgi:hypothetical protein
MGVLSIRRTMRTHVLVTFDAAVAQREVDEAAGDAALVHALGRVLADVHGGALLLSVEGIPAGGSRKT